MFTKIGEETSPRIGLTQGGFHAAEGLVLARYFMFTQVYFHKTRVAYDCHLKGALAEMLPNGKFPSLQGDSLLEYLTWDDWRVQGELAAGKGGEHGSRLCERNPYRLIYETTEIPSANDLAKYEKVRDKLGRLVKHEAKAGKAWYKLTQDQDIPIVSENPGALVLPLSEHSAAVKGLLQTSKRMLYCSAEEKEAAKNIVQAMEA